MNSEINLNYRFLISLLFRVLVIVGILFAISPFILSMFNSDKPLKTINNQYLTVNIAELKKGEIKKIVIGYVPIWIYKRRDAEIAQLSHITALLSDPSSSNSIQPQQFQNQYRSYGMEYFVFKPIESMRSCNIRYLEQPNSQLANMLASKNTDWLGGFTESCFGSVYDLSGRRYHGTGNQQQKNLTVPEYNIMQNSINNTLQHGDVIQFDLKKMVLN